MISYLKSASTLFSAGLVGLSLGVALYHGATPGLLAAEMSAQPEPDPSGVPVTRLTPLAGQVTGAIPAAVFAKPVERAVVVPVTPPAKARGHHAVTKHKVPHSAKAHGKHNNPA